MEPSVTAILTISLGGVFAAVIVTALVVAKRKKAPTDRHLDNGPVQRSGADGSHALTARMYPAAGTAADRADGTATGSHSDSGASSGSDTGGGGGFA